MSTEDSFRQFVEAVAKMREVQGRVFNPQRRVPLADVLAAEETVDDLVREWKQIFLPQLPEVPPPLPQLSDLSELFKLPDVPPSGSAK